MRKEDRALVDNLIRNIKSSDLFSPKSISSHESQSPLVSKLEEVSLKLADAGKLQSRIDNTDYTFASQENLGAVQTHHKCRSREEYGSIGTTDAFVIARSLRRYSSPQTGKAEPFHWQNDSLKSKVPDRLTLRAIIRPKAPGRQAFLVQRTVDINELRLTASPTASEKSCESASPSKATRKPLPIPSKGLRNSRRPSTALSPAQPEQSPKVTSHSTGYEKLIRDPKAVPIRKHFFLFHHIWC
jgi:hypothetical protein